MNKARSTFTRKILTFVRTLISYVMTGVVIILFVMPPFLMLCLPQKYRPYRAIFWFLDKGYKGALFATMIPITITMQGSIPDEPSIIVANHQSALDIPLVGALLNGKPHMWYVLAFYARMPVFGFLVRRLGVSVERDRPEGGVRSLVSGIRRMQKSTSHAIIFPEGTRHMDGAIHSFFKGFALLAKKTGRPVIPIYLNNPGVNYPIGSFLVHRRPIHIVVGNTYYYQDGDTAEQFTDRVQQWFIKEASLLSQSR